MLVFVIPLKCQKVSNSWDYVCKLLERCLRSICNQNNPNFHVVVVCHEKPDIQFEHQSLHYIQVDFPIPDSSLKQKREDKAKKSILGLRYASRFKPNYAMIVDADDCLSYNLANFVNEHSGCNGWFLNSGYVYQEKSVFIYYRKSHFHHWCGTCNILRFDLLPLPDSENDYPEQFLDYYSGSNHRNIEKSMRAQGTPLSPLPLVGAIYIIGNGENIYQEGFSSIHNANRGKVLFFLKELFKFRFLTPLTRKKFGLYKILLND
jgi:hypothetical protein